MPSSAETIRRALQPAHERQIEPAAGDAERGPVAQAQRQPCAAVAVGGQLEDAVKRHRQPHGLGAMDLAARHVELHDPPA